MSLKEKADDLTDSLKKESEVLQGERSKDKVYTSTNEFDSADKAIREFAFGRERLFQVSDWSDIPGIGNADFTIYDPDGYRVDNRMVAIGDFLKIDLPGPVPMYWVQVVDVKDEDDLAEFTVKPASDPTTPEKPEVVDHFFQEKARSTFRIAREGNKLVGMEIGVNEAINNQGEQAGDKAVINTLVSETGWAFFQKNQWKNLTDYLVGNTQ